MDNESKPGKRKVELQDLEITGDGFQELLAIVGARIAEHLEGLDKQPSWSTENYREVLDLPTWRIDGKPTDFNNLLNFLFEQAIPCSFNTASPGYLAYIPGGGLPQSAIADLIAAATNRYVGVRAAAPCLAAIEQEVLVWMCQLLGLPDGSGGILTSGGSLANWTAIVTARSKILGEDFLSGVLYCSEQSHHCIEKAARLCGIRSANIKKIPVDHQFRISIPELVKAITRDQMEGKRPFFVAANGGTTNTGAVDPLPELTKICQDYNLWLHVDAAYGGFFSLTEHGRKLLKGIGDADSVVVDPHKGMFLPYGSGALLVRNVGDLAEIHRLDADYLPPGDNQSEIVDFHEISPELSREFRGLRIWLPLKIYGEEPFRRNLREKLELTQWIYSRLRNTADLSEKIEIIAAPQLSVFAFRVRFSDDTQYEDRCNQELLRRVNARKRVFLTSTRLHGRFAIRICVLSFRTHQEHLTHCLEDLSDEIALMESEFVSGNSD